MIATEAEIAAGVKAYNATPDLPGRHRHAVKNAIEAAQSMRLTFPRICPECRAQQSYPGTLPAAPYIVALCLQHGGAR